MTVPATDNPILAAWQQTLARFGQAPAIYSNDGAVVRTFVEIGIEAVKVGRLFDRIPAHSVVAVQVGNSERVPEILLALWRRSLIPLLLGDIGATELAITLGTVHAAAYVTNEGGPLFVHRRPVPENATRWLGPVPHFLKLTSGTTSAPRAVRFRGGQLLADCQHICEAMGITDLDVNFGVIPFSHSYGFSNLILPLLVRGARLVVSSERLPRAVLEGIVQTKATVLPATPVFYQKFAELPQPPKLSSLRLCISAGASLPHQVAGLFSARYGLKIHTFYGATECGGIAYDATEDWRYEEGFVGVPMKGVDVAFADDAGPISVSGPAVGDGYFPHPEDAVLGGGYFVPSDLVRRTKQGLILVGRTSDIINVSGKKLNPLEVEAWLSEFPGVKQAIVFGVESSQRGEEPIACVVGKDVTRDALLHFCQEKLSAWKVPRDVWLVGEIPSNERGKISRRELAQSYRAHNKLT